LNLNLKDKVALVTGGSGGIGKAICLALAAEGAKVAVNYIDLGNQKEMAQAIAADIKEKFSAELTSAAKKRLSKCMMISSRNFPGSMCL